MMDILSFRAASVYSSTAGTLELLSQNAYLDLTLAQALPVDAVVDGQRPGHGFVRVEVCVQQVKDQIGRGEGRGRGVWGGEVGEGWRSENKTTMHE